MDNIKLSVASLRKNKNMSQAELIEAMCNIDESLRMTQPTLSSKENGASDFLWKEIQAISKIFGVPTDNIK